MIKNTRGEFATKVKSVSRQLLHRHWASYPSERFQEPFALSSGGDRNTQDSMNSFRKSRSASKWAQAGSTENITLLKGVQKLRISQFPRHFFNHCVQEVYHLDCTGKENFCRPRPMLCGVMLEVTACNLESSEISRTLESAVTGIEFPPTIQRRDRSANIKWTVSCFAPLQRMCEKTQVFFLYPSASQVLPLLNTPTGKAREWLSTLQQALCHAPGNVLISGAYFIPYDVDRSAFQSISLAGIHHRCLLHVENNAYIKKLFSSKVLDAIQSEGFLNYFPPEKLGVSLTKHFELTRCLLSKDFKGCMANLMRYAVRVNHALPNLWKRSFSSITKAEANMECKQFLKRLAGEVENECLAVRTVNSLLRHYHGKSAKNFLEALINCLPSKVADCMMHSVSEACFNAMASLRIQQHGKVVVPGDLVMQRPTVGYSSNVAIPSCHSPDTIAIPRSMLRQDTELSGPILVQDDEHARQFTLHDVVLPVVYPLMTAKEILFGKDTRKQCPWAVSFPQNCISRTAYEQFFANLDFQSAFFADLQSLHPSIAYRHITSRPLFEDGPHRFCWDMYHYANGAFHRLSSHEADTGLLTTRMNSGHSSALNHGGEYQSVWEVPGMHLNNLSAVSEMEICRQSSLMQKAGHSTLLPVALQMTLPPDSCIESALYSLFEEN